MRYMAMWGALWLMAAVPVQGAEAPQPGRLETYKDWITGCDNGLRCEAVSLVPGGDADIDGQIGLHVVREGGPAAAPVVSMRLPESVRGRLDLLIDGAVALSLTTKDDAPEIAGTQAAELLAAIARGNRLEARADGKTLGAASLAGSAAALRLMDARQGRAGTVTALVAKGKLGQRAVKAAPPLPLVYRVAAPQVDNGPRLWRDELDRAATLAGCTDEQTTMSEASVHPLGADRALVLLPCGAGAYNYLSVPLIAQGPVGRRQFALAMFDLKPGWSEDMSQPMLVNAGWDTRTGTLSSYAKGRGLGDCGNAETYVWDGHRFRATEVRMMGECRGGWDWITLWRARTAIKK